MTSLLYALGLDGEEILRTFYKHVPYKRAKEGWRVPFDANRLKGYKAVNDLVDADTGRVVVEAGKKLTVRQARQLAEKGLKAPAHDRRGIDRPLHRRGSGQCQDRRDLLPRPARRSPRRT